MDPWAALGISPGSERDEVKRAFREKVRTTHPDAGGDPEKFRQLQVAYKAALEQLSTGRVIGSAAQRANGGTSPASAPRREPGQEGWTINDFYQWRREQVQEEHDKWSDDANWNQPGAQQNWRKSWPGNAERDEREDRRYKAAKEERAQAEAEMREALGGNRKSRSSARSGSADTFRDRDLNKWDWADYKVPSQHGRRGRAASAEAGERDDASASWKYRKGNGNSEPSQTSGPAAAPAPGKEGDTVVSHRVLATAAGSVRVPIYEVPGGGRYYRSPLTSKKVNLPR